MFLSLLLKRTKIHAFFMHSCFWMKKKFRIYLIIIIYCYFFFYFWTCESIYYFTLVASQDLTSRQSYHSILTYLLLSFRWIITILTSQQTIHFTHQTFATINHLAQAKFYFLFFSSLQYHPIPFAYQIQILHQVLLLCLQYLNKLLLDYHKLQ